MTITETPTPTLSGAKLKVTLGALGVPPSYFAAANNVAMRTVVRWFDADIVPESAAAKLDELVELTREEEERMIRAANDDLAIRGDGCTMLRTYRIDKEFNHSDGLPAEWHRQLTLRVMRHLQEKGQEVKVEYV